jgi:hypothetical protein
MKKAAMAVAHRILTIAWHIIHDGGVYREAGSSHYDRLHPDRSARRLTRRLQQLGFEVTLKPQMSLGTSPKPDSPPAGNAAQTTGGRPETLSPMRALGHPLYSHLKPKADQ